MTIVLCVMVFIVGFALGFVYGILKIIKNNPFKSEKDDRPAAGEFEMGPLGKSVFVLKTIIDRQHEKWLQRKKAFDDHFFYRRFLSENESELFDLDALEKYCGSRWDPEGDESLKSYIRQINEMAIQNGDLPDDDNFIKSVFG